MATKKLNTKGTRGQDLTAARAELKQFRHDVSILRKKGILDKTIYDARSATPTKYLKSQLKKFANVLTGEAQPVKVSKARKKYYAGLGYTVKGDRVIVPKAKNEKVIPIRTKGGADFKVKAKGKGGSITELHKDYSKENLTKWIADLRADRMRLGTDEQLAFQIFGHNVRKSFGWINRPGGGKVSPQEQAAEYMERYQLAEQNRSDEHEEELIEAITVLKVERDPETGNWPIVTPDESRHKRDEEYRRRYNERQRHRREARMGAMSEKNFNRMRDEKAAAEKKRRANMSAAEKEKYKAAAKARAVASNAKRKTTKKQK